MGQPLRILIVEDSEGDAALLLAELCRGCYETALARLENAENMGGAALSSMRGPMRESSISKRNWDWL